MNERPGTPPSTTAPRPRKTLSKEEINLLEPFSGLPPDCIIVPNSREQFAQAAQEIRSAGAVGFDTESKPVFAKGAANLGPDIAQFATEERVFILQLRRPESMPFLKEILQAENILKIGFDLKSDRQLLQENYGVVMKGVLDLCSVFRKRGFRNTIGVTTAVGIILHRRFHKSKRVTTSNWGAAQLAPRQLEYAANDATAAFEVWHALGCPLPEKASRRSDRSLPPGSR